MRKATLLLLATIAVMLLLAQAATAVTTTCSTNPCNGTDQPDILTGTNVANDIRGLAGNDIIDARAGDDQLNGGDGADALYGQADNDTVYGGPGNDNFKTQFQVDPNGPDRSPNPPFGAGVNGGPGNDTIYGESGDDDLVGNAGADILDDGASSNDWDRAFGGTGKDTATVADGDTRDEVSCGTNLDAPSPEQDTVVDTAKIDVTYGTTPTGEIDREKIEDADKVYDCETVIDQNNNTVDKSKLPQNQPSSASFDPTPPAEPTA